MSISVLMSVYKAEKPEFLAESLESLKQQTLLADEVVLVEDGPISAELNGVIELYRQAVNIRSVRLPENIGLGAALNEGLKHCQHEIVARMDTDDIALPHRFAVQYQFMLDHPEIAACSSYVEEFSEDSAVTTIRKLPTAHREIVKYAKFRSPLSHPATIYRKSRVDSVGCYPPLFPEDQALWALMIVKRDQLANIPTVLLRMRTNRTFLDRRGWIFFKGQIAVLNFRKKLKQISMFEYGLNLVFLSIIRLPPARIRFILYAASRKI
jgi:glycosyltransferase involved in cell wall biosynthesis